MCVSSCSASRRARRWRARGLTASGCPLAAASFFLSTRDDRDQSERAPRRRARARPAARTVSSSDASFTKPAYKASSCASERASRSTPAVFVSRRGRSNHPRRISAARGSDMARSRKPASISASLGGSRLRRVARIAGSRPMARFPRGAGRHSMGARKARALSEPSAEARKGAQIGPTRPAAWAAQLAPLLPPGDGSRPREVYG